MSQKKRKFISNTQEHRIDELIKVLSEVLRQDSPNYCLNATINKLVL